MRALLACFGFLFHCTISSLEEIQGRARIYQVVRTERNSPWKWLEKEAPTIFKKKKTQIIKAQTVIKVSDSLPA